MNALLQCAVYLGVLVLLVKPLGAYMANVYEGRCRFLAPPQPYNCASSSGSNLGPTNKALHEAVAERLKQFEHKPVPADLVSASASGLDPHISPEAAQFQVSRVAKARGLTEERIQELLDRHIEARTFGLLGEARVNVLKLNLALDALK